MTRAQDLDAYARVRIERINNAIAARDGIATRAQMEVLREAYAHLNHDTPLLCFQRRKGI